MKQFDEIFSRKVKEAFDGYNADHLSEAAWQSYSKKYGKKRWFAIVIPLWAKAASVAVLLTIGTIYTYKAFDRKADSVIQLTEIDRAEFAEPELNDKVITDDNLMVSSTGQVTKAQPVVSKSKSSDLSKALRTDMALLGHPGGHISDSAEVEESVTNLNIAESPIESRLIGDANEDLQITPDKEVIIGFEEEKSATKRETALMTGLSGMMASIDNTSSASQGVSFGLYVDQQLTRRISIRPGLAIARHTYGVESASGISEAILDYTSPGIDGLSGKTTSYEADIDVLSMEVPVNFVFTIWNRSGSNLFISTGASTVIYLSQNVTGNFNNTYVKTTVNNMTGETTYQSLNSTVKVVSQEEPFNHVDLFGLANFSAGYSLPFGNTNKLLFEPFVQLPIKDLTSLNLKIRYGGLSVKVKF